MIRKSVLATVLLLSTLFISAQNVYFTKTGQITFKSHTDALDIEGKNSQVTSFLNVENGEIVFQLLIKSFKFTLATAEEHFNETYMESDKFPKASLKGTIVNKGEINLAVNGTYKVIVKGDLTIHGVTKPIEQQGTLVVKDGVIKASSEFKISIDDYAIKVPKLVEDRVAKTVDVKIEMDYTLYTK